MEAEGFYVPDSMDIPCCKCQKTCILESGAWLQTQVDFDEVTYVCPGCSGNWSLSAYVADSHEKGQYLVVDAPQIEAMIKMYSPKDDEGWDKIFNSVALWGLSGVKVQPGKYGLEVVKALLRLMTSVPESDRNESWHGIVKEATRLIETFSQMEGQWMRD